ncbi:hypothetical protein BH11PSE8_BH11PSE8_29220 [soil metagenome]
MRYGFSLEAALPVAAAQVSARLDVGSEGCGHDRPMKDKARSKNAQSTPTLERPSWEAAVLVCNTCKKRSNGPRGFKAKAVVQEARRALRDMKPRPRIVLTSCLGLCPKGALAVAVAGGGGETQICAIASLAQVEAAVPLLAGVARERG